MTTTATFDETRARLQELQEEHPELMRAVAHQEFWIRKLRECLYMEALGLDLEQPAPEDLVVPAFWEPGQDALAAQARLEAVRAADTIDEARYDEIPGFAASGITTAGEADGVFVYRADGGLWYGTGVDIEEASIDELRELHAALGHALTAH